MKNQAETYSWRLKYLVNGKRNYYVIDNYNSMKCNGGKKTSLGIKMLAKHGINPNEDKKEEQGP